ncbi:MAG TPA: adenylate/guanylate cyclase domain-containing protein [Rugosimonospora sp.]|nr:adenylate/guanylate cyclase domain-containing protein [Rugosimonospora sp.]
MRAPAAGQEERRTVTVLFVDLIGFTGIAERLDPEDLHQLQMAYFSTASAVIRGYGGIVEKYIGDAVMAVFGVPVETEHDAHRAVVAGLGLQRALDDTPLAGRYRMRARVGVATGEALVDLAAVRQSGEALVSGDVVATAARLQQYAPTGGVLVSAATRRATYSSVRYADEPLSLALAGKSGPVEAWLAREPVRHPAVIDDEVTPLVGRVHELDLLTAALTSCVREGEARLVSVVGGHGLGKSRLVRELCRRVEAMPELLVRWRVGRCLPYGESGTYGALAEIVKTEASILDNDDPATARDRLSEALAQVLPAESVPRLVELIGPLAGLPGRPANPGETHAAWRQVLFAMAQQVPTVLVLEDLHYADPVLLRFVTDLLGAAAGVPLFVLCTYRPELLSDQPLWSAALPGTLTVSLGALRGAKLRLLLSSLLQRHGLPDELADRLATITNGNPMYAVEYVHMLAERAAREVIDPDADLAIPETVHGVVANRIDLLGRDERTVLHAAAVLGEGIWPAALAAMVDMVEPEIGRILTGLIRRDMLASAGRGDGDGELTFRHVLLRDVAYGRLPRAARVTLHRRAADWLERVSVEGRHDGAAAVARHRLAVLTLAESLGADTGRDARAAREALTVAAQAAFATYAVAPALSHVEQALNLWPVDEEPDERRGCELLRCRLAFLADSERFYRDGGAKDLARLVERMREAGDGLGEARAETLLGLVEVVRVERQRALEHLGRAVELFADLPDSAAKAEAYGELARLRMVEYESAQALPAAQTAGEMAERLGLVDAAANARVTAAMARYIAGDRGGLDGLEECLVLCREQRLPALRRAAANLAVVQQEEGDISRAAQLQAESSSAQGAAVSAVLDHSEEAELAWFTGDWGTLLRAAEEYLDTDDSETTDWDLQLRGRRACLRLLRGEPPGDDLARCLAVARQSGFPRLLFVACGFTALGHALSGEPAAAAELVAELAGVWRSAPTALTVEWLSALAHTSALVAPADPAAADTAAEVVGTTLIRTRWVDAAQSLVDGARAAAVGAHERAAEAFVAAFRRYDAIGGASDAVLAAAWVARELTAAGSAGAAQPWAARVRAFAERNRAPGLVRLAE